MIAFGGSAEYCFGCNTLQCLVEYRLMQSFLIARTNRGIESTVHHYLIEVRRTERYVFWRKHPAGLIEHPCLYRERVKGLMTASVGIQWLDVLMFQFDI